MNDQNEPQVGGSGDVAGANQQPSSVSDSGASAAQPPTVSGLSAEDIRKIVQEELARAKQSVKDKRLGQLEGDVRSMRELLARLESGGANIPQSLKDDLWREDVEARLEGLVSPQPSVPDQGRSGTGGQVSDGLREVLREAGVSENDPEVTKLLTQPNIKAEEVVRLVVNRLKPQNPPAGAPPMPAQGGGRKRDQNVIAEEIADLQRKPRTPEVEKAIQERIKELREAGK